MLHEYRCVLGHSVKSISYFQFVLKLSEKQIENMQQRTADSIEANCAHHAGKRCFRVVFVYPPRGFCLLSTQNMLFKQLLALLVVKVGPPLKKR